MVDFAQTVITGSMQGFIYGLVALGFVLIYKASHTFNFAQGEMLLVGALFLWLFTTELHLPIWLALIITLLICFAIGWLLERFPLRPLIGESVVVLIMVTVALSSFFEAIALMIFGRKSIEYFPEFIPRGRVSLGELSLSTGHLWAAGFCLFVVLVFTLFFRRTTNGLRMRATAEGHLVAQSTGINVRMIIAISWAIAATVAAVGGILLGALTSVGMELSSVGLKAIPAALVGGLESIHGAIIAGLIIGIVESLTTMYIGFGLSEIVAYVLLVLVLIIRPHGLFGLETIERI